MDLKSCVLNAVSHKQSDKVPYCIRLTREAYKAYGEKLMRDFYCKEVQDDLACGNIDFTQAVDLSIGNSIIDIKAPWWTWDYDNMPQSYKDPFAQPEQMPPMIKQGSNEDFEHYYNSVQYISAKYQVFTASLIWGSHWEKAYFTRGIENFLADLACSPEFAQDLLDFIIKTNMEFLPKITQCKALDGVLLGSDWGTQNDLIMSPQTWRTMIKSGEEKQYNLIKAAGKKVMVHSCGCILRIMPDIIEMGVDILNPIQPECMDLQKLKSEYGQSITFWGGISTQQTLPYGSVEEVKSETKRVVDLMSQNGGYIISPSQEIQTDVPYENLKALIETSKLYG